MRERILRALFTTPPRVAFRRPWPGTRRGLKLWMLSIVIGLLGFNYIVSPIPDQTSAALGLADLVMPLPIWGALIIALACLAAFTAFCHHGRDRYGYALLAGFAVAWSIVYATGPFLFGASGRAFSGALTWLIIAGFLLFSAGDE